MTEEEKKQFYELELRKLIEERFAFVHPIVGDHSKCATGEPYIMFGIKYKKDNPEKLWNANQILFDAICQKQGAILPESGGGREIPSLLDARDERGNLGFVLSHPNVHPLPFKFALYWRRLPVIETEGDYSMVSCRLCISDVISIKGQLAQEHKDLHSPEKFPGNDIVTVSCGDKASIPSKATIYDAMKEIKEYYASLPDEEKKENG